MRPNTHAASALVRFGVLTSLVFVGQATADASQLLGPAFPPPGGVTFSSSGVGAADPGGKTFSFSNLNLLPFTELYWGPADATAVSVTMQNGLQTLTYDAGAIVPPGSAVWAGIAGWDDPAVPGAGLTMLNVRFTLTQTVPVGSTIVSAPACISGSGAVVDAFGGGTSFDVNLLFEVESPPGSNNWVPYNTLSQDAIYGGQVLSSFSGGFFWNPSPFAASVSDLGGGCGSAILGMTDPVLGMPLAFSVTQAQPNTPGVLFVTLPPPAPIFVPPCITLHIDFATALPSWNFATDGSGNWSGSIVVPDIAALAGVTIHSQAFTQDPLSLTGKGFDVTNGLVATLGY